MSLSDKENPISICNYRESQSETQCHKLSSFAWEATCFFVSYHVNLLLGELMLFSKFEILSSRSLVPKSRQSTRDKHRFTQNVRDGFTKEIDIKSPCLFAPLLAIPG